MIPLRLFLSGFLSYRDPVEIDFTSIELACIAGPNGAGKSSLLDAITWALFGQARKRDDALINAQSSVAEVRLVFAYEGNVYRVQRVKPRDKTMLLEFHILRQDGETPVEPGNLAFSAGDWKPLTERTLRETEACIERTLRMDYETFTNASFFLQGKADQFTQQRAGDRKRILSSILGLEVWETYRGRAVERRRLVEAEISTVEGRLKEIAAELAEEKVRKERLQELEKNLERLSKERKQQESTLQFARQVADRLAEQQRMVDSLSRLVQDARRRAEDAQRRLADRCQERDSYAELLANAGRIEAAYAAWQVSRGQLERMEEIASRFREHEKRREGPRLEIQAARARLEQEEQTLLQGLAAIEKVGEEIASLQPHIQAATLEVSLARARAERRARLDESLKAAHLRQADLKAENQSLKAPMEELKVRIDRLTEAEGAECPLCGQPLEPQERLDLIETLQAQGKEMGDQFRANQAALSQSEQLVADLQAQMDELAHAEADLLAHSQNLAQLNSRLEVFQAQQAAWEAGDALRLGEVTRALAAEDYAPQARKLLTEIDAELKDIGYDAAAHDAARQAELAGRASEAEMRLLETARAALAPLEREIADLQAQSVDLGKELARQEVEQRSAAEDLEGARAQAPDLEEAERVYYSLLEDENRLNGEVGAARQRVLVLDDQRVRQKELEAQRQELARLVTQYKQLERAFSKDGVPALLIEQALPEIETKANETLDRLSGGAMSVRFVTQASYKDKRRDDLRETLDIQISDGAGMRDYEMFSGGEAFRVNFAIRLALSEVLAQRAGARLQTLVIDEGFGSQDALGRQRLIEAINLVRPDFALILVITHIDELKDAFPNRIEVEKTDRGSTVQVI
jgi:exonuclease SbcC